MQTEHKETKGRKESFADAQWARHGRMRDEPEERLRRRLIGQNRAG